MKKFICMFLTVCILATSISTDSIAIENSKDFFYDYSSYYDTMYERYKHKMQGFLWEFLTNDHAFAYVCFKKEQDRNPNSAFNIALNMVSEITSGRNITNSIVDVAMDDVSNAQIYYYEIALTSLLMTMEDKFSSDPQKQSVADKTMKGRDYLIEGGIATANMLSELVGMGSNVSQLDELFSQAFSLCGLGIDSTGLMLDTVEKVEYLEKNAIIFKSHRNLLNIIIKSTNDQNLKKASENLVLGLDYSFQYKVNQLKDTGNSLIDVESGYFLNVLGEVAKQNNNEKLNTIVSIVSKCDAVIGYGKYLADITFGVSNIILRYYEMNAMALIREALINEITLYDNKVKSVQDYEDIQNVYKLLLDLLYVNARGEYCIYSLVMSDANLASLATKFFNGKKYDDWYQTVENTYRDAKTLIDEIIPDENDFIVEMQPLSNNDINIFLSQLYDYGLRSFDIDNVDWDEIGTFIFYYFRYDPDVEIVYDESNQHEYFYVEEERVDSVIQTYFGIEAPKQSFGSAIYENGKYRYIAGDYGELGMSLLIANNVEKIDSGYSINFDIAYVWPWYNRDENLTEDWNDYYNYNTEQLKNDEFCEIKGHGQAILEIKNDKYIIREFKTFDGYSTPLTEEECYNLLERYWKSLGNKNMPRYVELDDYNEYGYQFWGYYGGEDFAGTIFRISVDPNTGRLYDYTWNKYLDYPESVYGLGY